MEFSKLPEKKYTWNFNNGSLRRQQKKITNSFTSFHHTAYLENITNSNNGYRRFQSTNQALPPIPYILPKRIKVLNTFLNCSNTSCKANPDVTPHKRIPKKENLEIEIESIQKEVPKQVSSLSQETDDQALKFQQNDKSRHSLKSEKNEVDVIEKKNSETLKEDKLEVKEKSSNSVGFHESLKQNSLCGAIMKNLINQLTCAEQLFQNSHEENRKKIESASKLDAEDVDKFKSDLSDDNDRVKEIINKPLMSKKISNLRKIFEKKESEETIPNSNYSSSSSYHNHVNSDRNSKHSHLSKLTGNSDAINIKHSACLKSAIIDKIKEKVFSASKGILYYTNNVVNHNNPAPIDNNNNQNYIHQNNTLKFPKETSMAMKLLLNKRMAGLNENGNLENVLHSQQKIRTKKKIILKNDPNFPCHKNLLCTKGHHSGRCDVRQTNITKVFKNCQASRLHSNNYYEGDLDLLKNCLNIPLETH